MTSNCSSDWPLIAVAEPRLSPPSTTVSSLPYERAIPLNEFEKVEVSRMGAKGLPTYRHLSAAGPTTVSRSSSAPPRAEAATFAREGHETILSPCGASKAGKAPGQTPTAQEIAEL